MPRRGPDWSQAEQEIIEAHKGEPLEDLMRMLPGRSESAVRNAQYRRPGVKRTEKYEVKAPGEYLETLSAYFVDEPGCLEIWLRWNGYITGRELNRDMKVSALGIVTLLCEAK